MEYLAFILTAIWLILLLEYGASLFILTILAILILSVLYTTLKD